MKIENLSRQFRRGKPTMRNNKLGSLFSRSLVGTKWLITPAHYHSKVGRAYVGGLWDKVGHHYSRF